MNSTDRQYLTAWLVFVVFVVSLLMLVEHF
jgi:hypothetical protein